MNHGALAESESGAGGEIDGPVVDAKPLGGPIRNVRAVDLGPL
jgi:hypothetical protein